jgi:uncharacterized protein YeaO (DUF488 family)
MPDSNSFYNTSMKYVAVCFTDEKFQKTRERYVNELAAKDIFSEINQLTDALNKLEISALVYIYVLFYIV